LVGRKIYIIDFGNEIAVAAEKILKQGYDINYKTRAYKVKITGRLKISIVTTGKYIMTYFLADFMKHNSGIELIIDLTIKNKVIESLETM